MLCVHIVKYRRISTEYIFRFGPLCGAQHNAGMQACRAEHSRVEQRRAEPQCCGLLALDCS